MRAFLFLMVAVAAPTMAQNAPVQFDVARTAPLAVRRWDYVATLTGSEARFGTAFLVRCDRVARRVTLRRTAPVGAIAVTAMTITTDLATRLLPSDGVVANSDRTLDAIAFSRGRFVVDSGGGTRLILPASPELARSIQDCRN